MKQLFSKILLCSGLLTSSATFAGNYWQIVDPSIAPVKLQTMHPTAFMVYKLDEAPLKMELWNAPSVPAQGIIIALPLPDGSFRKFRIWESSLMPDELAAKYPEIRSFTGEAVDDPTVTAKLDFTMFGFDAMIFDGDNTCFVDPYDNLHDGFYLVHYKRNETRKFSDRMRCEVATEHTDLTTEKAAVLESKPAIKRAFKTANGWNLRTYRLALCANNFYCQAATGLPSPTVAQSLAKMTISMNRINGVYNREFSVQMNFVAKEDTLIWTLATGGVNGADPFNAINTNAPSCMNACQTQSTNRIGSANFDLGHVFTTGGGGQSAVGVVCNTTQKARSVTGSPAPVGDGYDIDFVAHEFGHEFGANHTFNNNSDGNCAGNRTGSVAYEPGSGTTIMAYAGICSPDDLAPHSDAYFHAASLNDIVTKLNGSENACAVSTSTGNKLVSIAPFTASYTIPYKTPFELIAPTAVDSVADTLTNYCWEQWNKSVATRFINTFEAGPIFRSYNPDKSPIRVFPKISMVMAGILSNAGAENNQGEKAPDTARYLTFKLTVRDIINGNGCVSFFDDTIHIDAVSTGVAGNFEGFKVTSQGTTGLSFAGTSNQVVTWNVVGTNVAPVNATNVTIYMSRDGGLTWPDSLGTFPNTGTATVNLPNPATTTTQARIKVKGTGNVFFNVNSKNFTVTNSTSSHVGVSTLSAPNNIISVYPNPATNLIHVEAASQQLSVYNTIGQLVYSGTVSGQSDIAVSTWARGVYFLHFTNKDNGELAVRQIVLQ